MLATLKNGVATIKKDMKLDRNHNLTEIRDLNLTQLNVLSGVELIITDETKINSSNDVTNHGKIHVQWGSVLTVEGNLINSGEIIFDNSDGLILKGRLDNTGKISEFRHPNDDDDAPPPELGRMIRAADILYGLGLFKGTGTDSKGLPTYDLEVAPTRQVAITMLVRLLGKEKEALSNTWHHPFDDVDSWANPYVGYAYSKGLTYGVSKMKFGSRDLVTTNQYITFVLRALGYNDNEGDFKWDNPTILSNEIGLTINEYNDNSAPFLRGDVAILSELALQRHMKEGDMKLLQYLFNNNAVTIEDIVKVGLGHLLD